MQNGHSTYLAFKFIVKAMENPTVAIDVKDHYGTLASDERLTLHIGNILNDSGLGTWWQVNRSMRTIKYLGRPWR